VAHVRHERSAAGIEIPLIATVAATVLAATLTWAAVAKLRSPRRTAEDFTSLGLRAPETLAWAVPATELAIAVLLVFLRSWGGLLASAVLIGFTTIIVRVLRHPEAYGDVSCACFGGTSHRRLSWRSLARNVVLLGLAVVASML
jgi:uncharacterized membrane protein YphA (DoxX/SURF4 family)